MPAAVTWAPKAHASQSSCCLWSSSCRSACCSKSSVWAGISIPKACGLQVNCPFSQLYLQQLSSIPPQPYQQECGSATDPSDPDVVTAVRTRLLTLWCGSHSYIITVPSSQRAWEKGEKLWPLNVGTAFLIGMPAWRKRDGLGRPSRVLQSWRGHCSISGLIVTSLASEPDATVLLLAMYTTRTISPILEKVGDPSWLR